MKKILLFLAIILTFDLVSQVSIRSIILTPTIEITRPTNTTTYTALDAVSSSSTAPVNLTFTSAIRTATNGGYITGAYIRTDQSTCTARFKLHVFTTTLTAINDNAAYTSLYTDNSIVIGSISFDAVSTEGTGSTSANSLNTSIRLPFKLSSGTSLYGLLETVDSFTPNSGQKFYIQLMIDPN